MLSNHMGAPAVAPPAGKRSDDEKDHGVGVYPFASRIGCCAGRVRKRRKQFRHSRGRGKGLLDDGVWKVALP